ncbi:hypothetical protein KY339_03325 [Candidatus Woesearchaeota archaeon]|nr:hypothetical protein [Candidatus Woesearchaeota archaeon]
MFNENEKKLLKALVEKELKEFEEEGDTIIDTIIPFLNLEVKYDEFLKSLLEKFG